MFKLESTGKTADDLWLLVCRFVPVLHILSILVMPDEVNVGQAASATRLLRPALPSPGLDLGRVCSGLHLEPYPFVRL